jgi:hypothetical protein
MANPFVGPQPIPEKRRIYGRNREIVEVRHLLIAERLVLLHSPSGAGKSSLVNAGLLPELGGLFDVWKPVRVNGTPPADSGWTNPFVWSVINGWGGGSVERVGLVEFVNGRRGRLSPLLIFDQFEEVLRVEAGERERQVEFFRELGLLLSDPGIWALFVIREDFLAPLLPLAALLPTHLRARYRLELLDLPRAEIVLRETAREEKREFEPEALTKLVHDLSLVKVQQADGSYREEPGGVVEPMQLQVAGWRLWEKTKEKIKPFRVEDVEAGGGVSEALGGYYAMRMEELARGTPGAESLLLNLSTESQANAKQETGNRQE